MRITWAIIWELYVLKKNTRSATQGDACYRRDARITINYPRARRRKETLATEGTQELSLI